MPDVILHGTTRGPHTVINLDGAQAGEISKCTHFATLVVHLDPIDRESAYYVEALFEGILVATSFPAFALPDSDELRFVFDPPVPFYQRVMTLRYFRNDEDDVRRDLQVSE